jgi:hypothetical protein
MSALESLGDLVNAIEHLRRLRALYIRSKMLKDGSCYCPKLQQAHET